MQLDSSGMVRRSRASVFWYSWLCAALSPSAASISSSFPIRKSAVFAVARISAAASSWAVPASSIASFISRAATVSSRTAGPPSRTASTTATTVPTRAAAAPAARNIPPVSPENTPSAFNAWNAFMAEFTPTIAAVSPPIVPIVAMIPFDSDSFSWINSFAQLIASVPSCVSTRSSGLNCSPMVDCRASIAESIRVISPFRLSSFTDAIRSAAPVQFVTELYRLWKSSFVAFRIASSPL